ncbi:MAG TPA: hypothetical protein VI669_17955 [Vicinamibacteria bacterium]
MSRGPRLALRFAFGAALLASPAFAQISPGKLSRPHAKLEGSTHCLECHEAGKGVSPPKCLACHPALQERVAAGKGLHARPAYRDCKTCHVEHQGQEFELVWWGKQGRAAFDHKETGHALEGKHASLACPDCHQARFNKRRDSLATQGVDLGRTYLGLGTTCVSCHTDEHRGQFAGRDCVSCHTQTAWKPAPGFDHAKTSWPLTGRHAAVACAKCHKGKGSDPAAKATYVTFKGVAGKDCASCHEDAHRGRLGPTCTTCHTPAGWKLGNKSAAFNHDKTAYPLRGRHANVACQKCHSPGKPLQVKSAHCTDCHADAHAGQFSRRADQGRCDACHDVSGFTPARFTLDDHQKTAYPLAGAHLAVACDACHRSGGPGGARTAVGGPTRNAQFRFPSTRCVDCHKDPHRGETDRLTKPEGCEGCHRVDSWRLVSFDHGRTRFALSGGHAKPKCVACHKKIEVGTPRERLQFAGLSLACQSCHKDPHVGQFTRAGEPSSCERCHTTEDVKASRFDHKRDSAYALDGAHAKLACAVCHRAETKDGVTFTRYKPLPQTCKGCHGPSVPVGKGDPS